MLALHSLRRSELLAVTWDDIDLDAGTIRVSGDVVQNEDHHFVTKATNKTATSTRTVPIMIPELRQALEAVPPEDRTGRLIPYAPHYIAELVNKACARANVPEVGTHGLRHSKDDGQEIRQAAAEAGQSVNAYILQAVKDRMQKENTNNH